VVLSRKLSEALAAERKILSIWLPVENDRPLYTAIRAAFIEKFARFYVLMTDCTSAPKRKGDVRARLQMEGVAAEIRQLDKESTQLAEMLFPAVNLPAIGRAREWAAQMGVSNWRDPNIVKFLRRVLKRWGIRRGRPATLQGIGLRALESRIANRPQSSWNALARELCNCGLAEHDFKCRENLRREVLLLKRSLRALRVKLPTAK
jgi:hypothetical protein